jgi:apoptosis-inducing factor 2
MKKVVIIGGGFAGSAAAKVFERNKSFNVTLIDTKDYFEFTPSILRTIIYPDHLKQIQVKHKSYLKNTKTIIAQVIDADLKKIKIKKGNKLRYINYDYLLITSGSRYATPMKDASLVIAARSKELKQYHKKLQESSKILIIGGGLVGVEIAGEIIDKYPKKKITIITSGPTLIPRQSKKAINYITNHLLKKGADIIYGKRIKEKRGDFFIIDEDTKIKSDLAFFCTGIHPNCGFLTNKLKFNLTKHHKVKVSSSLQFLSSKRIFAAGDIIDINEESLAQTAEIQGKIAAYNIIAQEKDETLKNYKLIKRPIAISLGKFNGVLDYNNLTFTGILPAILKYLIEKWFIFRLKYL